MVTDKSPIITTVISLRFQGSCTGIMAGTGNQLCGAVVSILCLTCAVASGIPTALISNLGILGKDTNMALEVIVLWQYTRDLLI